MNRRTCLVGYSGFVGSNLLAQTRFDDLYRSTNIAEIRGRRYSLLVCAGVPAVKWHANKFPEEDGANIDRLFDLFSTIEADRFVLISTVDVYPVTTGANESFDCASLPNHPYGTHRLALEQKLAARFPSLTVVRLPGLFGPGLKKNVLFDLLHDNCLPAINPASVFQYYDLRGLWGDLTTVLAADLPVVNLVTEPVSTETILNRYFPSKSVGSAASPAARYDLHTRYADRFGRSGSYRFSSAEVLEQLGRYLETVMPPPAA